MGDEVFGGPPGEVRAGTVAEPGQRSQIQVDVVVFAPAVPGEPRRILSLGEVKWGEPMTRRHLDRLRRARDLLTAKGFDARNAVLACYGENGFDDDLRAASDRGEGELWAEASLVATTHERQLVAAIQIVKRAPWPDTPNCPFAIELFTARAHRRRGIARSLVLAALDVIARAGQPQLALRVSPDNQAAQGLYRSLGFRDWST